MPFSIMAWNSLTLRDQMFLNSVVQCYVFPAAKLLTRLVRLHCYYLQIFGAPRTRSHPASPTTSIITTFTLINFAGQWYFSVLRRQNWTSYDKVCINLIFVASITMIYFLTGGRTSSSMHTSKTKLVTGTNTYYTLACCCFWHLSK